MSGPLIDVTASLADVEPPRWARMSSVAPGAGVMLAVVQLAPLVHGLALLVVSTVAWGHDGEGTAGRRPQCRTARRGERVPARDVVDPQARERRDAR